MRMMMTILGLVFMASTVAAQAPATAALEARVSKLERAMTDAGRSLLFRADPAVVTGQFPRPMASAPPVFVVQRAAPVVVKSTRPVGYARLVAATTSYLPVAPVRRTLTFFGSLGVAPQP